MSQNNHCSFILFINSECQIKCQILIGDKEIERNVKICNNDKEYIPITISFDVNEILIGQQTDTTIDFFKDWANQPEEYKEYRFTYQNKEYIAIAEVLFSLLINEYKKKVERLYVIDETTVQIDITNAYLHNRMVISLKSLGLKNIMINPIDYNYKPYGEILHEIIYKRTEFDKYKRLIERGKKINTNINEKKLLTIDNSKVMTDEIFHKITSKFSMKKKNSNEINTTG